MTYTHFEIQPYSIKVGSYYISAYPPANKTPGKMCDYLHSDMIIRPLLLNEDTGEYSGVFASHKEAQKVLNNYQEGKMSTRITPSDTSITGWVENKIAEFVGLKRMFTAYDVTTAIRRENPKYNIDHQNVRHLVDRFFKSSGVFQDYDRSLVDIDEDNIPWVYYAPGQNPYSYVKAAKTAPSPATSGANIVHAELVSITN